MVSGTAEATFCVKFEGVELQMDAVAVDHNFSRVDLLIGPSALRGNMVLQVREGRVFFIQAIQLDEGDLAVEKRWYPVQTVSDLLIPSGSQNMVPVQADGPATTGEL